MTVTCSKCGAQHSIAEAQLAGHPRVQFRCSKCGTMTMVEIELRPDITRVMSPVPEFARSAGAPRLARSGPDESHLRLPEGKAISLSVIAGPARGKVFPVQKPRIIVGRTSADLEIEDAQISRWHCAIEIQDNLVRLRDLESTNGTFFADERVRVAELTHLSEFRIGASVLLLSITPRLSAPSSAIPPNPAK